MASRILWRGNALFSQRTGTIRRFATGSAFSQARIKPVKAENLDDLLAEPTWSVESLLPSQAAKLDVPEITSKQLHHLLRLSALPPPESSEAGQKMLKTLSAQLHFVGEIQQVDTEGVNPLRAIRDETTATEKEQTVTLETLKNALVKERVVGKHYKRTQRLTDPVDAKAAEDWNVLGSAERKAGRFFVVESGVAQEEAFE
ncbi:hypothetical protein M011DRAFT_478691 [Sporormia fimetaria CBS 119925]|uniref:Glutamyl-tRNA amidotransferase complex subunit Gta3 domain-containing protein n=1 Tax=Sporormia fimetaria CBS 119925 TaxID=1340428 RepID=A0A6A6V788_9PLEO|nr:hypothetical protein M011DRAFT_478691 [Sporormia fimetaria CBS 119925]